jgi:hypothetical protein
MEMELRDNASVVTYLMQTRLTFCNRTLVENFQSDFDFYFSIKP